jgi:hypothetical protein
MKTRSGFVSNSSSSSYVIVGYDVSVSYEDVADKLGLEDDDELWEEFYFNDDVFGVSLASISSDDGDVIESIDMNEVSDAFATMKDTALKLGIDGEPKLLLVSSYG